MDMSERKKIILRAIIDDYIETAEPVSSKTISQNPQLSLSSATIRNEMAELTSMGYLEQPHTSAGRIPSALGYRIYVNELMERHKLSIAETEAINNSLRVRMQQLDKLISDIGQIAAKVIKYPTYALSASSESVTIKRFDCISIDDYTFITVIMLNNNKVENKLVQMQTAVPKEFLQKVFAYFNVYFTGIHDSDITVDLISAAERATCDIYGIVAIVSGFVINVLNESISKRTFVAGAPHIFEQPEYRDFEKAQKLLNFLSGDSLQTSLPLPEAEEKTRILIGPENVAEELKDSSVIVASYDAGNNMRGLLGVVGPTRMDYAKVEAQLSYIANGLSFLFNRGDIPPPADEKHIE